MDERSKKLTEERDKMGSWGRLVKDRTDAIVEFSGKKVLDVGCSSGEYVRFLKAKGYDAYGMDILPDERWEEEGLSGRFKEGDITGMPYGDGSFDTVLAFEVLEHVADTQAALKELYRVSRKNVIISVPNCSQPPEFKASGFAFHHWADRTHVRFFTPESLRQEAGKAGFKIENEKYINQVYPGVLFLSSWQVPSAVAWAFARIAARLPFRKKYYMTILVEASKPQ